MNEAKNIKAYKCEECMGVGTINGNNCPNCLGSGFVGRDDKYEYILKKGEDGRLIIADIKTKDDLPQKINSVSKKTTDNWEKKKEKLTKGFINFILLTLVILLLILYFTLLDKNQSALTLIIILVLILLILNLPLLNLDQRLKKLIVDQWKEPEDLIKYIKSIE